MSWGYSPVCIWTELVCGGTYDEAERVSTIMEYDSKSHGRIVRGSYVNVNVRVCVCVCVCMYVSVYECVYVWWRASGG